MLLVDTVLPFGLRASSKIFCALSDTVEWIVISEHVTHLDHQRQSVHETWKF